MTYARSRLDRPRYALMLLGALWLTIFFASLFTPSILDDADATHASAAKSMAITGDWVTLHVDGVRYLEKAPLPYWLAAISFRIFGFNTFAAHLSLSLAVLALALLGYRWAQRVFGPRTALYTGLFTLTSAGVFLFTRFFLPEVLLSLFLAVALYAQLRSLEENASPLFAYLVPTAIAAAVLSKGLVAIIFFCGAVLIYLTLTGEYKKWRRTRPFSATLLFLVLAAPWHILAGLRNRGGMNGHGFFWFYFINEHVLRFLGRRVPMDYNRLSTPLYWSLHLIWLFPWSLLAPLALALGWKAWREFRPKEPLSPQQKTASLLIIFSSIVLVFFSLSTNQEYYTFPAYLPLLMLLAAALAQAEVSDEHRWTRWTSAAHAAFATIGMVVAATLTYGLWQARHLPYVSDIGEVLAHRGVGNYTLSMSHFFDLTGPSFAALRLPAGLAAAALALGPIVAWMLRSRRPLAATLCIAGTSTVFLIAAHLAFIRFAPMLSSADFAEQIQSLQNGRRIATDSQIMIYGDQAYGSSLTFYLNGPIYLVDGRSTSMLFGSTFPDAPPIFLSSSDLVRAWGSGPRKVLFVPLEQRVAVASLLGPRAIVLKESSGKVLLTDRPLDDLAGGQDLR